MKVFRFNLILLFLVTLGCGPSKETIVDLSDPDYLHESMQVLTDIMVHDIFSPPVASRVYVYPSIAAYEVLAQNDDSYNSLAGQLNGLNQIPSAPLDTISYALAAIHAFIQVSESLVFSTDKLIDFQAEMDAEIRENGMSESAIEKAKVYGQKVAYHILEWADDDNYKETRTYPKYSFTEEEGRWQPTPPSYMPAIEPHWMKIRPFALDSATQFVPDPPTPFSMSKSSKFYKETMEVYEVLSEENEEKIAIANFWDCNPYVSHQTGHVMYATKKITPGGHWVGITGIASRLSNADFIKTAQAYAFTTIALADAFISCWDEKYRSSLIRPETVINKHIDSDWQPALQTPPFPEHTSGHSVISTAAAITLTDLFGDSFSYTDDVEVKYGLPSRDFNSFLEASAEAAVSRLYGGIHYRPAIDYGVAQGKMVGNFIVEKLDWH